MSLDAFGSRRVTRSLKEVAAYLDEGVKVASGIAPGQTVRLDLEDAPAALSPRLTQVSWVGTGTRVLPAPPLHTRVDVDLLALGDDLQDTVVFKIVGAGPGAAFFEAHEIADNQEDHFTAKLTLLDAAPGVYHALSVNAAGHTFLLKDALEIHAPVDAGLQLGGIVPNFGYEGGSVAAVLVLLNGRPTAYEVTDTDDIAQPGWSVQEITELDFRTRIGQSQGYAQYLAQLQRLYKGSNRIFLRIDIPAGAGQFSGKGKGPQGHDQRLFCLVAKDSAGSQDRLAFFVRQSQGAGA